MKPGHPRPRPEKNPPGAGPDRREEHERLHGHVTSNGCTVESDPGRAACRMTSSWTRRAALCLAMRTSTATVASSRPRCSPGSTRPATAPCCSRRWSSSPRRCWTTSRNLVEEEEGRGDHRRHHRGRRREVDPPAGGEVVTAAVTVNRSGSPPSARRKNPAGSGGPRGGPGLRWAHLPTGSLTGREVALPRLRAIVRATAPRVAQRNHIPLQAPHEALRSTLIALLAVA